MDNRVTGGVVGDWGCGFWGGLVWLEWRWSWRSEVGLVVEGRVRRLESSGGCLVRRWELVLFGRRWVGKIVCREELRGEGSGWSRISIGGRCVRFESWWWFRCLVSVSSSESRGKI